MTPGYTPQIGDTIKRPQWDDDSAVTVVATDRGTFAAVALQTEWNDWYDLAGDWVKVGPEDPSWRDFEMLPSVVDPNTPGRLRG